MSLCSGHNRVKGTVNGTTTLYMGTWYEWSGGAGTSYYYFGGQRVALRANSQTSYIHGDHLTSATNTTGSQASGPQRYYPYGEVRGSTTVVTPYRYTGQREEAGIGLYYYNARWYDPALGRFIQPDTVVPDLADPRELNRYSYCLNNPIRYTDPTGHDAGGLPWLYPQSNPNPFGFPADPLTPEQKEIARRAAEKFGIPEELLLATLAMEVEDDTDWWDAPLDYYLQEVPLAMHYAATDPWARLAVDLFLSGYRHYFGLLKGRGPGNGLANIHMKTAEEVEAYFAENYPDEHLLDSPPDHYVRSALLLTDEGSIYYAAAVLRRNADLRKGTKRSHLDDLGATDMEIIYGAYRCQCWNDWSEYQTATSAPKKSRGPWAGPYLRLYAQEE